MTAPERRLWGAVRGGQIGVKLRRQVPLGPYIVDFYCAAARLVVELDGVTHVESGPDRVRDAWMSAHGYRVLRVWNSAVMSNLAGVLHLIQMECGTAPSPNPLPRGERAFAVAGEVGG